MYTVFLAILNRAYTASVLILIVFVLRLLLRHFDRIPRWCYPLFWTIAAVRLVMPFSIPSPLGLLPRTQLVYPEIIPDAYASHPTVGSVTRAIQPVVDSILTPGNGDSVNPMYVFTNVAAWIWAAGGVVMLLYLAVSTIRMRRLLREAVPYRENIWLCDHVHTPFLFGIVRPRIYLPSAMGVAENDDSTDTVEAVIRHEKAHLSRFDHITKPAGFLILAVYWFCPTVWLAYILFCRDLEYACDARVIAGLDTEGRKSYSNALLSCATGEKLPICPVAFGENSVKGRIRAVLSYKKPPFWCILVVIVTAIVLAVCFLTSPREAADPIPNETTNETQSEPMIHLTFGEDGTQTLYPTKSGATIVVRNREDDAPDAEEPFYEDADFVYVFPQIISDRITVALSGGSSVGITEALQKGYITLDDLTCTGIAYNKVEKSPEQKLVDKLISSIRCAYGQITFSIPESSGKWSLYIAGAYVIADGEVTVSGAGNADAGQFVMSSHFLEDTVWETGKSYTFDYGKVDGTDAWYRSLDMDIVYDGYERTVSLTALFPEALTGGAENGMPEMNVVPIS